MEINEIKIIRKKLGLTQSQLSKRAQVSQSLIAKIEAGLIDPAYSKVQQIFDALSTFEAKNEKIASDLMNTKIISVWEEDHVTEAISKLREHSISQMPVYDKKERPVGIITETSIVDAIAKIPQEKFGVMKAEDIMETLPPLVPKHMKFKVLASLLKEYPILLVGCKGKIVGLVTKSDLLKEIKS